MAKDKTALPQSTSILALSALSGKSITGLVCYTHGSTQVIEITHSTGSQWIKCKQGQIEVGGTNEWGTGTIV